MGDDPILKKKVTAAEFAAIKATQSFTKLQMPIEWWLEHSNVDAAGVSYPPVNTSGQYVEAGATTYFASWASLFANMSMHALTDPECVTAAGVFVTGSSPWFSRIPVVITADGAGAIGAAVEVTAAGAAGKKKDAIWTCYVSISGLYKLDFIEATGAAAAPVPDYHAAPVSAYLVAGYPHQFRIMNTTVATNLGVNAMANGSWPNGAVMTIVGMDRSI